MTIKSQIPNVITLLNLFSGCIAVVYASQGYFDWAFLFVCLGIFLDFFDGFFARMFKVQSELGLQLDSLADMVTSGVVPGLVMYQFLKRLVADSWTFEFLPYIGFVITLGACYRLANFNIDTRQTDSFIGLPTPANALFIMSLPLVVLYEQDTIVSGLLNNQWVLVVISFLSAFIMNAEIPLFSLKVKNFSFKKNALQVFFLTTSVVLILLFRYLGIAMVILLYVLLSVFNNLLAKK
jgi:CDP-diacylglycerol---serine O-phosphatidyltransferase